MRKMIIGIALVLMLTSLVPVEAQFMPLRSSVENYWDAAGSPQLEASVVGTNEFQRGDKAILGVALTNIGKITGYKPEKKPEDSKEKTLAEREFSLEKGKTMAFPTTGKLRSLTEYITVQSSEQVNEALLSGQKSKEPMEFAIEIDNNAPNGEYTLALDLFYLYQENVEVGAQGIDPLLGLKGFRQSSQFAMLSQSINLSVVVKSKADFQVVNVDADLNAGEKDGNIKITYKNIGEETARDAIARISLFAPFSSTDDQASLGTIDLGGEKSVTFKLDVNDDATTGNYSINSEIKYTDLKGNSVISENVNIPVNVAPAEKSYMNLVILAVIALVVIGVYVFKRKKT